MNSKKQTRILQEVDLGSDHASKMELSVQKFNRFNNNNIIITQVLQTYQQLLQMMKHYKLKKQTPVLALKKGNSNRTPAQEKKKVVLTGNSIVNGISEKGLSVNQEVKTVNFSGGTSGKILEKPDDIIKEKPDDLIVHVGTNDITNNVNVKKSSIKFLKNHHRLLSRFHLSLTAMTRRTSRKP